MYTTFWKLDGNQAQRLQEYMGSVFYRQPLGEAYRQSQFWVDQSAQTFAAVNGNVVMLHSGFPFAKPPVIGGFKKAILNFIRRSGLLLGFIHKTFGPSHALALAQYQRHMAKGRKAFQRLRSLEVFKGFDYSVPMVIQEALAYNEFTVYNSLENLLFIKKFLDGNRDDLRFFEIGAGAGVTSLALLDSFHKSKVIICDLPATVCVGYTVASYFSKGKYRIVLPHEVTNDVLTEGSYDVAFITPNQVELISDSSVDCVINSSSMQEMEMHTIESYFSLIKRVCKGKSRSIFFCKNLEVSKQYSDTRFDNYPWRLLSGTTLYDGLSEYITYSHREDGRAMKVRVDVVKP